MQAAEVIIAIAEMVILTSYCQEKSVSGSQRILYTMIGTGNTEPHIQPLSCMPTRREVLQDCLLYTPVDLFTGESVTGPSISHVRTHIL